MNTLQRESADKMILCIGADNWPMPIPIVKKGSAWVFDIQKGKQEILNRRIGRNELQVIDALHAYVDAQHEYATKDCGGSGKVEFAQRLISTEGKRDGLYWEAKEGEKESPIGPLVALAAKEGYFNPDLQPFHGYYFRILKGQRKHADGGAYNYVVKGKKRQSFEYQYPKYTFIHSISSRKGPGCLSAIINPICLISAGLSTGASETTSPRKEDTKSLKGKKGEIQVPGCVTKLVWYATPSAVLVVLRRSR